MNMYEIKGTGKYFGPFYVKANTVSEALAKATDIMYSGKNAAVMHERIDEYVMSVSRTD